MKVVQKRRQQIIEMTKPKNGESIFGFRLLKLLLFSSDYKQQKAALRKCMFRLQLQIAALCKKTVICQLQNL